MRSELQAFRPPRSQGLNELLHSPSAVHRLAHKTKSKSDRCLYSKQVLYTCLRGFSAKRTQNQLSSWHWVTKSADWWLQFMPNHLVPVLVLSVLGMQLKNSHI